MEGTVLCLDGILHLDFAIRSSPVLVSNQSSLLGNYSDVEGSVPVLHKEGGSKMNPYVWVNQKYDWVIANKKAFWAEIAVYVTFGSIVVTAFGHLIPEFWLKVQFFSIMGFWVSFALIRIFWLFGAPRRCANEPFKEP